MVPADSTGISPVPAYSGYPTQQKHFPYGTITPYGMPSQTSPVTFLSIPRVLQPRTCRDMYGLGSSAFARHYSRNHYYFLFLRVLRCFSSPGSHSLRNIPCGMGCPIRKSADQTVCAGPRSLSQLATSFFASESLGIPRTPLSTWTPRVPSCTHSGFVRVTKYQIPIMKPSIRRPHSLLNMSMNLPQPPYGTAHVKSAKSKIQTTGCPGFPERRCSSRTFRYGYLVTT
jgi:hypothetical protein